MGEGEGPQAEVLTPCTPAGDGLEGGGPGALGARLSPPSLRYLCYLCTCEHGAPVCTWTQRAALGRAWGLVRQLFSQGHSEQSTQTHECPEDLNSSPAWGGGGGEWETGG